MQLVVPIAFAGPHPPARLVMAAELSLGGLFAQVCHLGWSFGMPATAHLTAALAIEAVSRSRWIQSARTSAARCVSRCAAVEWISDQRVAAGYSEG